MKEKQIEGLVHEVPNGNQVAFESLYEEAKKTVYFICISFLNNEEAARDNDVEISENITINQEECWDDVVMPYRHKLAMVC